MSLGNVFYEITSFSPAIPTLPYFRESSRENHFNQQTVTIETASEEANVFLKGVSREVTILSKSSCLYGLTSGLAASFLFKNPIPFFLGLSACFPRAYAQQKVGNEFQVNTYTNNAQGNPSVASFSNGNFVVTWTSDGQDGDLLGVYGQLFNKNGVKIGNEFRANSFTSDHQSESSVASLVNGNFVVSWQSRWQEGEFSEVYGQLFDGNGNKIGNEFRANSYTTESQGQPSIAGLNNGNFVILWSSYGQDSSGDGVYGQLFAENGNKIGSEFRVNTYTTGAQRYSSVASFSNGNFVVNWSSLGQDGGSEGVYGQLFAENGNKIGNEFRVNTYTNNAQTRPSVASLVDGNFVVTWESSGQDGSSYGIYGQLFDKNGIKIGSEFQVNSYTTDRQQNPSITSLVDGNFVVTWQSHGQDGDNYGVYGQLFDKNGEKIGSEFQVNSYITDLQMQPSVAGLVDDNFVVTWESRNQDGSNYGVYGQIFHDNITYPLSSSITRSSTTSTTQTTSSTTSSISSSTLSATGRTRTSVNPSSSRTTVPSITKPLTSRNSKTTLSATSDPRQRFSWIWFLLGGVGAVSCCFVLIGYYLFKSRNKKKDDGVQALELGERKQVDDSNQEDGYQYTPDVVSAADQDRYQYTPDVVKAGNGEVD